jgi:hypothetical protein
MKFRSMITRLLAAMQTDERCRSHPSGPQALAAPSANGRSGSATVTVVTGITNGPINADIGVSQGNTVTGFGPYLFLGTSTLTNAVAAQAQLDLTAAYDLLAGLPCAPANAMVADLGGTTLAAGVYCSATGINVTGPLTLIGRALARNGGVLLGSNNTITLPLSAHLAASSIS